jgi:intracellular multiplication protein IcmP
MLLLFFSCFIIGGLAWIIWTVFHVQLKTALYWIRYTELYAGMFMHGDDFAVRHPFLRGAGNQTIGIWRNWMPRMHPTQLDGEAIKVLSTVAVVPIRWLFAGALGIMSLWVIFRGPNTHYKRRMGLESLMREQAKSFPAIRPFLKFDPRTLPFRAPGSPVPAQLPLFSEALSPEEWLAYNEVGVVGGQIDVNRAWQALGRQLGRRWQGPLRLPPHAQALYAVFALKHARKRKESQDILNALSDAWSPEKGLRLPLKVRREIRRAIKDPKIGGALQKYADLHAYETTALLRCLSRARQEGGVLAPAEFLWLRGHDRDLWYPLNNLGRKSYHAEAAGAMVHYTNELIAGQKIPTPRFEEVIRGLETYMKSGAARQIPELDKKAGGMRYWKRK